MKGIVVGYPLDKDGNPMGKHNVFIEDFLEQLAEKGVLRSTPVTLVNEYESSMQAKAKIFEQLTRVAQSGELPALLGEMSTAALPAEYRMLLGTQTNEVQVQTKYKAVGPLDASVLLRKGIYDKVAAQVILQRFLDFYNSEDDRIVVKVVNQEPAHLKKLAEAQKPETVMIGEKKL